MKSNTSYIVGLTQINFYKRKIIHFPHLLHYVFIYSRYITLYEAVWRIFAFPIHVKKPAVERLFFHLPGQHSVYYHDHEDINDVLSKPTVSESMFTSWMNANRIYAEARKLTYP